ncbi:MAG: hypothetical protein VYA55_15035 [Pseudomonadota bacterium]|nr:hypothetical protein [Pseudomonadota bacterium]
MSNLKSLIKYFKGGAAEDERDIRGEVFVPPENMDDLLSFDFHSNVILLGNKGVGKSIFVNVLHEAYLKNNELSVLITPDDLECDPILERKTLSDRKSVAYAQMLKAVACIIGAHSNKNEIAISEELVALQKLAISEGYSKADLISKFSSFLSKITPYGGDVAQSLLAQQNSLMRVNKLTEAVEQYLSKKGHTLWLFIDDIDAAVAKDSRNSFDYGACWAIVSAAIELSQDIPNLKCLVSIRSDIWHVMIKVQRHGEERKDKLGFIHELKFSENELRNIFKRRIRLAAADAKSRDGIYAFFKNVQVLLPGESGNLRTWDQWLAKISRNRPRDLVKAVQMLIGDAKKNKQDQIGDDNAHNILLNFGKERVENIVDEYDKMCPQIREIVNDLTIKNTFTFVELMEHLEKAPARRQTQIDGVPMQQTKEHAIKLLRILHMACFINPRLENEDDESEYKHFNFHDYPDLIDFTRLNELQKYKWQVHPAYHTYSYDMRQKKKNLSNL